MRINRRDTPRCPQLFKLFTATSKSQLFRMVLLAMRDAGASMKPGDRQALVKAIEDLRYRANVTGKGAEPRHPAPPSLRPDGHPETTPEA